MDGVGDADWDGDCEGVAEPLSDGEAVAVEGSVAPALGDSLDAANGLVPVSPGSVDVDGVGEPLVVTLVDVADNVGFTIARIWFS